MGCQGSKNTPNDNVDKSQNGDTVKDNLKNVIELDESAAKGLTTKQKELIMETWKKLVENISNVGVITFMNLFETHPDVQDVFMPFKGLSKEELRHSKELRAHGLRVMGFVQKVVARLDEPEKSENLLRELGRNHVMYGAKIQYVDLIGPQFVFSVKPSMEEHWSDDIEEAWIQLFRYMAYIMKKAMLECINPPPDTNGDTNKENPKAHKENNKTNKEKEIDREKNEKTDDVKDNSENDTGILQKDNENSINEKEKIQSES